MCKIIGGADGPTAIFVSSPNFLHIRIAIFIGSLILGALIVLLKRR